MNYEINDEAIVRRDLCADSSYGPYGVCATNEMLKYRGKTVIIQSIVNFRDKGLRYTIKEESCYWVDEMFEDKPFPKKWAIKTYKEVGQWLNKYYTVSRGSKQDFDYTRCTANYFCYPDLKDSHQRTDIPEGYEEITIEQFREFVLNPIKKAMKQIIGYQCPMPLFDGMISKSTLYMKYAPNPNLYAPIETSCKGEIYLLPKEVVERWNPVYQELNRTAFFGNVEFTVKGDENFTTTKYGEISKDAIAGMLNYINNPPELHGYALNTKGITTIQPLFSDNEVFYIGCTQGTVRQLREIYELFSK